MDNFHKGIIFVLIDILLAATNGTGLKLAVSNMDTYSVTVYIGLFATLALAIYLAINGKLSKTYAEFSRQKLFFILAGILGLGVQQIFYLKSYALLPASEAVIIFYIYPLLMVLFASLFFKEKTSKLSWLFLFIGFGGVYVLISRGQLIIPQFGLGAIMTLLAAATWALFSVLIKHYHFDVDIGMFLFNLFGFLFLVAMIPVFGFVPDITALELSGLLYLAIVPTAIAFILWNNALRLVPISICSNISLLVPVLSLMLISVVLKDAISVWHMIGLALILGSILLNLLFTKRLQSRKV
jgi:drug/metabolite transporter (DMT)-like permease